MQHGFLVESSFITKTINGRTAAVLILIGLEAAQEVGVFRLAVCAMELQGLNRLMREHKADKDAKVMKYW